MTNPVSVPLLQSQYAVLKQENDTLREGRHTGGGNPPGGDDVEKRVEKLETTISDVQLRLIRIETRLETVDDRMATKADLHELTATFHKTMNEQTWKFIGAATALAAIAFTAARFIQ